MSDAAVIAFAVVIVSTFLALWAVYYATSTLLERAAKAELGRETERGDRWQTTAGERLKRQQELERDLRDLAARGRRLRAAARDRDLALGDPDDDAAFDRVLRSGEGPGGDRGTLADAGAGQPAAPVG